MKKILTLVFMCISGYTAQADEIKDYVQYQKVRTSHTYAQAAEQGSKGLVIVWVGVPDDDAAFQQWRLHKNEAFHVFVDTCGQYPPGTVVVAGDHDGLFVQLEAVVYTPNDSTATITRACLSAKDKKFPQPAASCPNGRCPLQQPSCSNGRCYVR